MTSPLGNFGLAPHSPAPSGHQLGASIARTLQARALAALLNALVSVPAGLGALLVLVCSLIDVLLTGSIAGLSLASLSRPALALSLLFSGGYLYGINGLGVSSTGAAFTAAVTSSSNTFTTPSTFTVTGLTAVGVASPTAGVRVDWTAVSWGTAYNVYRGLSAGTISPSPINSSPLAAGTASYLDTTAEVGTTYYYTVRALNSRGVLGPAPAPVSGTPSSDTTPPSLISLSPSDGTISVGTDSQMAVAFSEPMETTSTISAISLVPCTDSTCTTTGTAVSFNAPQWNGTNSAVQLTPASSLSASTYYKLAVSSAATDLASRTLQNPGRAIFRTASGQDTVSPQVVPPTYPADGAVNVPLNASIVIPFSEAMQQTATQGAVSVVCETGQTGCTDPSASGYSFSWNSDGTVMTLTPGTLSAIKSYVLQITGAAKDLAGNRLAGVTTDATIAYSAKLFTTGTTSDSTPPVVVPPTTPEDGQTLVATNVAIVIRFSEAMQQSNTESALTLACIAGATCTIPSPLTFSWNTSGTALTISHPGFSASSTYSVSVGPAARDLVGNDMCSPGPVCTSFSFSTGTGPDTTVPGAVTITSPSADTWTSGSTFPVSGTTPENTLQVNVWRDANGNGTFESADDPLVTTVQLYGSLTTFSIDVPLAAGQANRFLVTASDVSGNQSAVVALPIIYQGDRRTTPGTVTASTGNTTITVYAPFSGDLAVAGNTQNTATVEWSKTGTFTATSCGTGDAGICSMSRTSEQFSYTISGLSSNTLYYVRVTFSDADGVVGTATQTVNVTTLSGSRTGLISGMSISRNRIASAAPHSTTTSFGVPSNVDRAKVLIKDSTSATVRDLGCITPSDPVAPATTTTVTFTWDGKNGSSQYVPDGVYTAVVEASESNSCGSNAQQEVGGFIVVSNVTAIALSPAPASITLGSGDSVIVLATLRNARNELVADGVPVTWSAAGSSTTNFTVDAPTSQTGTSTGVCTVASGSGQACTRVTVGTAVTQTITITATVASQDPADTTVPVTPRTIAASTTVNDPPSPPSGLQLSLGSIRMRWNPSPDPRVAGYVIAIGPRPREYETTIDVGAETSYRYEPVRPGARYYVTVRSYDRNGQLSPLGDEASILIPLNPTATATATATQTAMATSSPSATRTATATAAATTPTGTATATKTAEGTATSTATTPAGETGENTGTATGVTTATPASTSTAVPSVTPSATLSRTPTATATTTASHTPTATPMATAVQTETATETSTTGTATVPSATSTAGSTGAATSTAVATTAAASTSTVPPFATAVPTPTAAPLSTSTPSPTPVPSPSPVGTTPTSAPTIAVTSTPATTRPEASATATSGP